MKQKSLATVGVNSDHACDQCGAVAASIEPSPDGGFLLLCARCGAAHGNLLPTTVRLIEDAARVFGAAPEPMTIPRAMIENANAMKREDIFPSPYLKAADLGNKPVVFEITTVKLEALKALDGKQQNKLVLTFKNGSKALVVNRTNFDSIAEIYGEETAGWVGKRIEIYPDRTKMGPKTVDCIRVRSASVAGDMDDKIGF